MIQQELGTRLRDLRKARGYSQETFARKSGIDRTYIASVEAGKRNISIDNIKKIADALNVTLSDLFDFTKPIHNTILLTIKGTSFLLESSTELTPAIKDEIELIARLVFDKDESSILEYSKCKSVDELLQDDVFNIVECLKGAIEHELNIRTNFKTIETEIKLTLK